MNSRLSRCSTASGSGSRISLEGFTKVKAHKSFLFTEGSLKVEIKHTCLILLSHSMNDEKLPYLGLCL